MDYVQYLFDQADMRRRQAMNVPALGPVYGVLLTDAEALTEAAKRLRELEHMAAILTVPECYYGVVRDEVAQEIERLRAECRELTRRCEAYHRMLNERDGIIANLGREVPPREPMSNSLKEDNGA